MAKKLTLLQSRLDPYGYPMSRSFEDIHSFFEYFGLDLSSEISLRLAKALVAVNRNKENNPVTILDVGCGRGKAIEGVVKRMSEVINRKDLVQGMGLDVNPVPENENSPVKYISGAAERMPIESDQVDVLYSSNLLQFVDDLEATLNEGYRVLKQGGVAMWQYIGEKDIAQMIADTPGSVEVFHYFPSPSEEAARSSVILCRKLESDKFNGFETKKSLRRGVEDIQNPVSDGVDSIMDGS